jgi:MFS family permease
MISVSTMPGVAGYRGLFARPVLRTLAVADVCARLPQGMVSITLLLVAAQYASMTVAGLVVAGYTLGQAATGPVRGRLADRRGLVPVASVCVTAYTLGLLALLATSLARAPAGLLIGTVTLAGLVNPPLSPGMRSLWSKAAGGRLTQTAFALDAAVLDLAYITGPVLASALATGLAPAAAAAVLLALTGAAVIIIITPARRPGTPEPPPARGGRAAGRPVPRAHPGHAVRRGAAGPGHRDPVLGQLDHERRRGRGRRPGRARLGPARSRPGLGRRGRDRRCPQRAPRPVRPK